MISTLHLSCHSWGIGCEARFAAHAPAVTLSSASFMPVSIPTALVAAAPTLLREGLFTMLRKHWPQLHLTPTADATQVAELMAHRSFSLIVLEESLVGCQLPILLDRLYRTRPNQRLVVLSDPRSRVPRAGSPAGLGTRLLIPSHVPPHSLAAALAPWLDAAGEESPMPQRKAHPYLVTENFSARELEVLRLVVADHCNEEIANNLFISVRTVETHRRNLLQKAGARTLVGLVARAVREGWVA